jgi:MFS family permease
MHLSALTVLALSLTITRLLFGAVLKKVPQYMVLISVWLLYLPAVYCMLEANTLFTAVTAMMLLGIGYAAAFPIVLGYISELYSNVIRHCIQYSFVYSTDRQYIHKLSCRNNFPELRE